MHNLRQHLLRFKWNSGTGGAYERLAVMLQRRARCISKRIHRPLILARMPDFNRALARILALIVEDRYIQFQMPRLLLNAIQRRQR